MRSIMPIALYAVESMICAILNSQVLPSVAI